ncbi:MAG: protein kinase [Deltaproteobacteria bacterium]|nr:protein kinase [Deltaproteobacteria bacterium]
MELNRDGEPRGPPPDPLVGRLLLHYRVLEAIGQGGMSVVYRGRDEHLARDVAIKVLHPFLREKAECRTRLAREARAVARLEHPNVVKVFDFSGDRPTLDEKPGSNNDDIRHMPQEGFIVCELVKGPTLKRHAEKHSLWRCPEVGAMAVWQLALALQHAHDNGVVHRDLKPENVMVRDDGCLKLMDFGIAQIADQGSLTITGTLLGSPAHMAPECIDGLPADERSDLFSLGTVLYWVCTGCLPFEALTPHALLKQIVDGKAPPAQQKSPRVSDDLARVIHKAIATKPTERFQTAIEFAAALADVLDKSGLPADSGTIRRVLCEPALRVPECSAAVRAAFLERAEKCLSEGATTRALSSLNRVLADDASDPAARALLDRLDAESNDDDVASLPSSIVSGTPGTGTPAPGNSFPPGTPAFAFTPVPFPTGPHAAPGATDPGFAGSPTVTLAPPPVRWQSLFVGVAAVGLVVAAVAIARAVDDVATPLAAVAPVVPAKVEAPNDAEIGTTRGTPGAFVDDDDDAPDPDRKKRRPRDRHPGVALPMITHDKIALAKALAPVVVEQRRVKFAVRKGWAHIVVDGVTIAEGKTDFETTLSVGPHVVTYKHPQAKDSTVPFTVPPKTARDPAVFELPLATLEPRPALLKVHCNMPDASVEVVGGGGGITTAQDSEARPLLVPMGDESRITREVFVFKKGYVAFKQKVLFSANELQQLDVMLKEDLGDGDKDAPAPVP